jgi:putative membrane protein
MRSNRGIVLHYVFRSFLSGAFAYYIYHLVQTDTLSYFIAPRMEVIVKLSAIGLAVIAVYLCFAAFWSLKGTLPSCGCDHTPSKSPIRNTIAYSLFVAPLLLGLFVPDAVMGSSVVDKKGIILSKGSSGSANSQALEGGSAYRKGSLFYSEDPYEKQYSKLAEKLYLQDPIIMEESMFLEISTAIDLYMKPFQGKTIQVGGFVYRQEGMTKNQFVIARLAMECCSADSTPYGFLVEWPEAVTLEEDAWVTVTGTIGASDYGGMEIVTIQAESVMPMPVPETPYVYPNYDILSE